MKKVLLFLVVILLVITGVKSQSFENQSTIVASNVGVKASKIAVINDGCNGPGSDGICMLWVQLDGYYSIYSVSTTWLVTYRTSATSYHTYELVIGLPQQSPTDFYWTYTDPLPHFGAHEVFVSCEFQHLN